MYTIVDKSISVFGTFELNLDIVKSIAEKFKDLRLETGKDQQGNLVARLRDPEGKQPMNLNFSHNRLDYFMWQFSNDARQDLLKMIDGMTLVLESIKDYGINRLAYNVRSFIEDKDDAKRKQLGDRVQLLNTDAPMVETQIRLNYINNIMGEDINTVINVQDAKVRSKKLENGDYIKCLIVSSDVNTLSSNVQARFEPKMFESMFAQMMELSHKSIDDVDKLLK